MCMFESVYVYDIAYDIRTSEGQRHSIFNESVFVRLHSGGLIDTRILCKMSCS